MDKVGQYLNLLFERHEHLRAIKRARERLAVISATGQKLIDGMTDDEKDRCKEQLKIARGSILSSYKDADLRKVRYESGYRGVALEENL